MNKDIIAGILGAACVAVFIIYIICKNRLHKQALKQLEEEYRKERDSHEH